MKYYDDDYDADEVYPTKDETVRRPEIQLESLRGLDWLLALILSCVSGGLLFFWAFPGLTPDAWTDAAIGAGLRPMEAIFPGFWNAIAHGLYSAAGVSTGTILLKIIGRVIVGMSVGFVYLLLRQILSITIRVRLQFSSRRFFVVRGVAVLGALFFACSDPVWRAGQAFTPPLLLLFITILVLTLFFSFLMSGGMKQIYLSMFLLGLLSAETPMGFFLLALVWGVYLLALRHGAVASDSPILNPIVEQSSKWHLTFLYAFGLVIGIAVNCTTFILFDGLAVFEVTGGDMPLLYATRWWMQFIHAASGLGWVLCIGIGMLPFVVSAVLLPRAVDEEQFLPYHMGAVFFVTGALSFAQLAELPPLWFWTWSGAATVDSPYFLLVLMLFSAASVVFALAVMAVDICCRDHRRLAMQRFAELKEEEGEVTEGITDFKPLGAGARLVLFVVPVLLLAGVVPGRYQGRTREMLAIVEDYAHEVLKECGGKSESKVKWIFTDGKFDSYIELLAACEWRELYALSMIHRNASLDSPREKYISMRGVKNDEEAGNIMKVRWWVKDHPERLSEVAFQIGFEVWRREGKGMPPISGVLSRQVGMSEEERLNGVQVATNLSGRILDIYENGGLSKSASTRVSELFESVQWRLARLARLRSDYADGMKMPELALREKELSEKLDDYNESFKSIQKDMKEARARTLNAVTPLESLQMAIQRRNFAVAATHAELILQGKPDHLLATWAVAMNYYEQKQWALAEKYLKKCCEKKPQEPAFWNNLAIACLHMKRYDEALSLAEKALQLIPESDEVKDTVKQIREARQKAKEDASKAQESPAGKPEGAQTPPIAATNAPAQAASSNAVPTDAYAVFAVGMSHFGKEEWDPAVEHFTRCVAQKPDEPMFLSYLAKSLYRKGSYAEALEHARK
nr:tetratricopeptide repeat protein [Bacteroidales bacterium]